jgi:uncharacterized membrane protein
MRFNPPQLSVRAGDTVEWRNQDIFAHSVTANDGSFDSGLIAPGSTWKKTFDVAGTFGYHCRPHPNMTASVQVGGVPATDSHSAVQNLKWEPPKFPEQIHPILVNFTAALLPLALVCDVLGRTLRRESLQHAGLWMVVFAAAITPFTAAAGWWWKHASGSELPANLIRVHQWLGTCAAGLFVVLAVWRWKLEARRMPASTAYLAFVFVATLALVYQGTLGGRMVFGK